MGTGTDLVAAQTRHAHEGTLQSVAEDSIRPTQQERTTRHCQSGGLLHVRFWQRFGQYPLRRTLFTRTLHVC
jgi:hypothetical protein